MDDTRVMIESSICASLRGEARPWSTSNDSELDRRFHDCVAYHGVGPLLSRRLQVMPPWNYRATRELKDAAAIELVRTRELVRLLGALAESGVVPLVLKGAAFAHTIYASPALRPRADTDLLINSSDRVLTARTLSELGYENPNAISGELITYQCGYVRRDRFDIDHVLDVHWRINNTQMFSRTLGYEELISRSVPLLALGGNARAAASADALLLACMHRVHHLHSPYHVEAVPSLGGDRLIWLYDIHLLVEVMSPVELEGFARLAEEKEMRTICSDGVLQAQRRFGTRIPGNILQYLARPGRAEPSARHLRVGDARYLLTELRSLPRWRDRIALLCEHLFPPANYMLEKYAATSRVRLPMLYLQRGIHGAWRRILNP